MKDQARHHYWPYRLLSIFDNFIAVLFLFSVMVNFGAVGFYPPLLLPLFIALSILVYTNLSAVFARQVLQSRRPLRSKLKDWIKVNAYVTLVYAVFQFVVISVALISGTLIEKVSDTFGLPAGTLRGMMIFLMLCSAGFVVHVIMTLRYLKQYRSFFQDSPTRTSE
jgi:hypothetical protein